MRLPIRWRRFGILTAASVSAAVFALPQAAIAAGLTDGTVYRPSSTTSYDVNPTRSTWSAVAVYSPYQWNVSLFSGAGGWLASSTAPMGQTDFIAINSYARPLATYRAEATRVSGSPGYVQWRQASQKVVLPYPANDGVDGPSDPDIAIVSIRRSDVVSVATMWLGAGESFWVDTIPNREFFLLETNPYSSGSTILTRSGATYVPGMRVVGNCTLYRANYTGWHGLLMVTNLTPMVTKPVSGFAVALHRFDPARPNTCPQRNFPDYTPPGP